MTGSVLVSHFYEIIRRYIGGEKAIVGLHDGELGVSFGCLQDVSLLFQRLIQQGIFPEGLDGDKGEMQGHYANAYDLDGPGHGMNFNIPAGTGPAGDCMYYCCAAKLSSCLLNWASFSG